MAKLLINDTSLKAIGNAIREKSGKTEMISVANMPSEILGIETGETVIGFEPPVFTDDCSNMFSSRQWDWTVRDFGDFITTSGITSANNMFYDFPNIDIPFDLNFAPVTSNNPINSGFCNEMFHHCKSNEITGKIKNLQLVNGTNMFNYCINLRYIPEFEDFSIYSDNCTLAQASPTTSDGFFNSCYSLRSIPESFLKNLHSTYNSIFPYFFDNCSSLDEIKGLSPQSGVLTSNKFNGTFTSCYRLKDVIFDVQDDGTPFDASWKKQLIDLSYYVGWCDYDGYITTRNNGITSSKKVNNAETYQSLKNDADWFTTNVAYSRYNRTSAKNTIKSLPDTSAYLSENGGTNTIKFKGSAGSSTDGGAINTMTSSEIAVATSKGWTVSLV